MVFRARTFLVSLRNAPAAAGRGRVVERLSRRTFIALKTVPDVSKVHYRSAKREYPVAAYYDLHADF